MFIQCTSFMFAVLITMIQCYPMQDLNAHPGSSQRIHKRDAVSNTRLEKVLGTYLNLLKLEQAKPHSLDLAEPLTNDNEDSGKDETSLAKRQQGWYIQYGKRGFETPEAYKQKLMLASFNNRMEREIPRYVQKQTSLNDENDLELFAKLIHSVDQSNRGIPVSAETEKTSFNKDKLLELIIDDIMNSTPNSLHQGGRSQSRSSGVPLYDTL